MSVVSVSPAVVCQSESHSVMSVSMSVIQAIQQVAALINQIYQSSSQIRHAIGLLVTCSITESLTGSLFKTLINPVSESNSTCFFSSQKEFAFLQTRGKRFSSLTGLKTV